MKILEGTVERGDSDKVFFEKPKGIGMIIYVM